jgi:hypothetical protein
MTTIHLLIFLLTIFLAKFGMVFLGFAISLAVVGKGRRWIWLVIAIPLFLAVWALGKWLVSVWDIADMGMFDLAIPFTAAALLVPCAQKFRRWSENRSVLHNRL